MKYLGMLGRHYHFILSKYIILKFLYFSIWLFSNKLKIDGNTKEWSGDWNAYTCIYYFNLIFISKYIYKRSVTLLSFVIMFIVGDKQWPLQFAAHNYVTHWNI